MTTKPVTTKRGRRRAREVGGSRRAPATIRTGPVDWRSPREDPTGRWWILEGRQPDQPADARVETDDMNSVGWRVLGRNAQPDRVAKYQVSEDEKSLSKQLLEIPVVRTSSQQDELQAAFLDAVVEPVLSLERWPKSICMDRLVEVVAEEGWSVTGTLDGSFSAIHDSARVPGITVRATANELLRVEMMLGVRTELSDASKHVYGAALNAVNASVHFLRPFVRHSVEYAFGYAAVMPVAVAASCLPVALASLMTGVRCFGVREWRAVGCEDLIDSAEALMGDWETNV
ncbi:MAG: hypothetical protein ACYTHJ_06625 [Planctomycetota bacterium]